MTIRNSLFAKILTWFFLNLVLIAVVIWVVYEFQIGPASPFLGQSEERIRREAIAISRDLMGAPRAQWPRVLNDHESRYRNQVTFHLVGADGKRLTGGKLALPKPVTEKLPPAGPPPQSNFYRRVVESRYPDLNATSRQVTGIMVAWQDYYGTRNRLNDELRQADLNRTQRFVEWNQRHGEMMQKMRDNIQNLLNDEQKSTYQRIIAQQRNRRPGPPRTLFPRLSEQQLTRHFGQADINADGTLDRGEMRRFILETAQTPPPSRPAGRIPQGFGQPDRGNPGQNRPPRPDPPVFTITTSNPTRYWAGTEIAVKILDLNATLSTDDPVDNVTGLREVYRPRERRTHFLATLVFESESLGAGGLFSDPLPWVPLVIAAVVLSALFWLPMVRNITRPIAEVTAATEQIAEGRFEARVGTSRGDEIGRVGQAVDHMADRLAGFVKGQKRFLGDISHELCSPIARIQAALANLEQRADDSQKKYVADLSEEVGHMSELVDELLMFSKAGMKPADVKLQPVSLAEAAQRVIDREGATAATLKVDIAGDLKVNADPSLLARALGNLLRNAVRYAGQSGPIELRAKTDGSNVQITLADQGPGVPADLLPHIFDPFFRPEQARSRDTGGAGLGLSIVKSCIEACEGQVSCRNRKPTGLEFHVTLKKV